MGGGKMLQKSWYDLVDIGKPQDPQKSGDEIALDIIARAGLHQKGGE